MEMLGNIDILGMDSSQRYIIEIKFLQQRDGTMKAGTKLSADEALQTMKAGNERHRTARGCVPRKSARGSGGRGGSPMRLWKTAELSFCNPMAFFTVQKFS